MKERKEVHKMFSVEILRAYEEYQLECYYEGRTPVSFWAWLGGEE
jgi:hypothetical protein